MGEGVKLRTALPAGVVDTAATALSTFILQAYAVRVFEGGDLGVYSLFLTAGLLAGLVPQFLVLYPVEVAVLEREAPGRIGAFGGSARFLGLMPLAGLAGALVAIALAGGEGSGSLRLGFAVTGAFASATMPIYAHFKNLLHLSQRNWYAARVAGTQLALVVVLLGLFLALDMPGQWIPFFVLGLSQLGAVLAGAGGLGWATVAAARVDRTMRTLVRSGRWLVISGLIPAAGALIAAALVAGLAGAEELGDAQAAHVAARPVLVFAAGVASVLSVRSMEAGRERRRAEGTRLWRIYVALMAAAAGLYGALGGFDWALNPVAALLPRAYEVEWLVVAMVAANLMASFSRPVRAEFIGGGAERAVAGVDSIGAVALVAVAVFSAGLESFAIPGGVAASGAVGLAAYGWLRPGFFESRASLTDEVDRATLSGERGRMTLPKE